MFRRNLIAVAVFLFVGVETASAQSINRIVGKWNNDVNGENVVIAPDAVGGWQFWSSDVGQGRISTTSYQGGNVKVESRGLACYYYVTLTAGYKMNWQLRAGDQGCTSTVFTRAE